MRADTVAQLADDVESVAFADALADRLGLRRIAFGDSETSGAALAVAPAAGRHLRDVAVPTVTLTRSATARGLQGRVVICGARDEGDAPALAIADAMACVLELPLLVVHVLPAIRAYAYPSLAVPPRGDTREDRAWAAAMLDRLAGAAGVAAPGDQGSRVLCGGAATELAALARTEDAALLVVSGTQRSWLQRALLPSATNLLARHGERPVIVCPRDPLAAMRVREALEWHACRRPT
jgi:nucleotide-binding universal stress UspA family protein